MASRTHSMGRSASAPSMDLSPISNGASSALSAGGYLHAPLEVRCVLVPGEDRDLQGLHTGLLLVLDADLGRTLGDSRSVARFRRRNTDPFRGPPGELVVDLGSGAIVSRHATERYPYGVAVAPNGEVYVSAWGGHTVSVFTPNESGRLDDGGRIGPDPDTFAVA